MRMMMSTVGVGLRQGETTLWQWGQIRAFFGAFSAMDGLSSGLKCRYLLLKIAIEGKVLRGKYLNAEKQG
jgi:hypothetical protein